MFLPIATTILANNNFEPNENNSVNDAFENGFVGIHFMKSQRSTILKKAADTICTERLHTPTPL